MNGVLAIPMIILGALAAAVVLAAFIYLFAALFGLTWKVFRNIFRFIGAEVTDALRLVGSVLSAVLFAPLVVLNIIIGRWSASRHFAGAFWSECRAAGRGVYRLAIGNPARLFGMGQALEGVEQRVPQAMAAAPGRDKPARRVGQFDGYTIVGSLQGGGSGSKLYIAQPDDIKRAGFARQGLADIDRVVIKVFSLKDGSSLPQIVRESRALDAAKKLGLVLEHELTPDRFFYVMRYVPGDALSSVTTRLHTESPADGLDNRRLGITLGYAADLLAALDAYHHAGLWHKDVKPDNIIVDSSDGRAHLVDFGLVTPLRSAMTLTTHGTEYFRDPELVRQALRGVKVHQIDGSKFDVYAAGAVLFSMVENSFPAHGGLSQITRRCPEALRWIVRRAMTDYDRRYGSAAEMLADLRVVLTAADPFKLKPIDLPSVNGQAAAFQPDPIPEPFSPVPGAAAAGQAAFRPSAEPNAAPQTPAPAGRPRLSVSDWWTGRYSVMGQPAAPTPVQHRAARSPVPHAVPAPPMSPRPLVPQTGRKPAAQQVVDARTRARQRRLSAQQRINARRAGRPTYSNTPTAGVVFAGLLGVGVFIALAAIVGSMMSSRGVSLQAGVTPEPPSPPDFGHILDDLAALDPVALPEVEARVLVVSDLALPLDPERLTRVQSGLSLLRQKGAQITGDLTGEGDEAVLDQIASLRRDRGSLPIDSMQLPARVREWLQGQDLDAVLLIAPDPEDGELTRGLLIADQFFTSTQWTGNASDYITVLAGNGFVPEGSPSRAPRKSPKAPKSPTGQD